MKYKAGDKVRVREDLSKEEYYDGCYVNSEMGEFAGRVVTISRAPELTNRYGIKEDNMRWCWTDEMFKTLEDKNTTDETNVSEEWVLCKDDTESHADATEAAVDVNCLLEAKFKEAVSKITPDELKEILLKKIEESVKNMSDDVIQDILAEALC
ncbi:hypothetical protein DW954_02500 [Clostridium sp. AM45-5]|nr:hypothetical protein [Clostridium sp. AM45-5]RHS68225.1 hypothetical protein DW954_02500 [Clostridium sp. AM45-5]